LIRALNAEDPKRALDAARKLGLLQSVPGLTQMVRHKDSKLIDEYSQEFRFRCGPELGHAIEDLLIENFDDVALRKSLGSLFFHCPPYQSRRLFDLLLAAVRQGGDRWQTHTMAQLMVSTGLAIEPEVLDLLAQLPKPTVPQPSLCAGYGTPREEVIGFLSKRRYVPAVPEFQRLLKDAGAELGITCEALTKIGTRASLRSAVECVDRFRREAPNEAACGVRGIFDALGELPPDAPLDFSAFRHALAPKPEDPFIGQYIGLIKQRHERQGVTDLLAYLDTGPDAPGRLYQTALEALLDFESPEVWQQALEHVERQHTQGHLPEGNYRFATGALQQRLQSPEKFVAQKHESERQAKIQEEAGDELRRRSAALEPIRYLRQGNPEEYVRRYQELLKVWEADGRAHPDRERRITLTNSIGFEYLRLGTFTRFALRRFQEALSFYEKASEFVPAEQQWLIHIARADLYQFELRDSGKAIAEYERVLAPLEQQARAAPQRDESGMQPSLTWIAREIDYLKTGVPFSGVIGRSDVGQIFMVIMGYTNPGLDDVGAIDSRLEQLVRSDATQARPSVDGAKLAEVLDTLPSSRLILARTVYLLPYLPVDAILRYLDRQDPGHFLSASLLGAAVLEESQLPSGEAARDGRDFDLFPPAALRDAAGKKGTLVVAAASFARATGIRLKVAPDPRFSSPDKTWESFLAALNAGDAEAALACFASSKAAQFRPLFTGMSAQQMKDMAASFIAFVPMSDMGNMKEYGLTRIVNGERRAGFAYFQDEAGEWKIGEM
jgi:tetratricopeptide (TPR) repeat protein